MEGLIEREWLDKFGKHYEVSIVVNGKKISQTIIEGRFSTSRNEVYTNVINRAIKELNDK